MSKREKPEKKARRSIFRADLSQIVGFSSSSSEDRNTIISQISIDLQVCIGCGLCAEVCPFGLPQPNSIGLFEIKNVEKCVGCSACSRNCPVHAIFLEEQKGCGCIWCDETSDTCCDNN